MPIQICRTCGTSYPDALQPPARCPICEDERQFVPRAGQAWITREQLANGHVNGWRRLEPDLFEIHTHPGFGYRFQAQPSREAATGQSPNTGKATPPLEAHAQMDG